jgi:hypothetical protein
MIVHRTGNQTAEARHPVSRRHALDRQQSKTIPRCEAGAPAKPEIIAATADKAADGTGAFVAERFQLV